MIELWNTLTARAGLTITEAQHARLNRYLDLLLQANTTMNLTRIIERGAAEVQHVGDALTLLPLLPAGNCSLADVGSGGGVPGIPLAIARPEMQVLLIESTKKKAAFLERIVAQLELTNVRVSNDRAEDVGRSGRRQSFDVAVARAVATVDWLAEWCLPLVKVGGKVLMMKGKRAEVETPVAARAVRLLGGGEIVSHPVELPGARNLVILEITKTGRTDLKYPRPATLAKGMPLR
ncbi:MAG TPA: 16S rRNA (guanine(527)-N(7))-methyltransferase RsmG [Tepidisphaeraceae bacterium]|nr:16S rRNA (guanine(527)-N(7))-methyltransferase RsmG [Tepidisphaeraceae bacterium]